MPRKSKQESLKTRNKVLDSAERRFSEFGFAYTTLTQIAQDAGVTRGGVYTHFKNKSELFRAILERSLSPLAALIQKFEIHNSSDPLLEFRESLVECVRLVASNERVRRVLALLWNQPAPMERQECIDISHLAQISQIFSDMRLTLERARKIGKLPEKFDIDFAASMLQHIFIGLLRSLVALPRAFPTEPNLERTVSALFDMISCSKALLHPDGASLSHTALCG
ncbi:TetR family transcriptional regulator [Paraburkholderia sacchari]|nr:TetR family transcriptional regulator [Paraburkholderia sacchari]